MSSYVTVWDGSRASGSLYDLFTSERDQLLWQTRRNALAEAAPGNSLPTCAELRTQTRPRRDPSALQQKRVHAKANGKCRRCYHRPIAPGLASQCRPCADKHNTWLRKWRKA